MKRKVKLLGTLGDLFGQEYTVDCIYLKDVFKCISANNPKFHQFILNNKEDFFIEMSSDNIELPLQDKEIIIGLAPSGSKSGGAKIVAAIAIIAIAWWNPYGWAYGAGTAGIDGSAAAAGSLTFAGEASLALAANLALTGIQQIMAPDPATDSKAPENYLFNGGQQNIVEGDPIPVLYGELMVPGTPISFELVNKPFYKGNTYTDHVGNILLV